MLPDHCTTERDGATVRLCVLCSGMTSVILSADLSLSLSIYIYIYIYITYVIDLPVCVYTYVCVYIYIYIHIHTYVCPLIALLMLTHVQLLREPLTRQPEIIWIGKHDRTLPTADVTWAIGDTYSQLRCLQYIETAHRLSNNKSYAGLRYDQDMHSSTEWHSPNNNSPQRRSKQTFWGWKSTPDTRCQWLMWTNLHLWQARLRISYFQTFDSVW